MCSPGQAIAFDNRAPHGAQRVGLLVELRRVLIQVAIAEGGKLFGGAKLMILAATIGAAWQRLGEGARARPDAQALHRFRQKPLLKRAARLLEKLLDSLVIALDQPLLKSRHYAFSVDFPIKSMQLYNHISSS